MRKGQRREAQLWAKVLVEGYTVKLQERLNEEKGDFAKVFPFAVNLPKALKGPSMRICQEVNLAKKQYDERELGKKLESEVKLAELMKKGGEAGNTYIPQIVNWVLKTKEEEGDLVSFWATPPTGRVKAQGGMLALVMGLMDEMDQGRPKREKPVDPMIAYMEGKLQEKDKTDPQEDILASFMKGEEG